MKASRLLVLAYILLFGYMIVGIFYTSNYVNYKMTEGSDVEGYAEYNLYNVSIEVLQDGSLRITEIINVSFLAYEGAFKFGYRIINIQGFDDIKDFEAFEKSNGSLIKLKTEFIKAFGKIGMKFYFSHPITDGMGFFILKYVVVNAIWAEGEKNYLRWIPFPEQHPPIKNANFAVIIPKRINVNVWTDRHVDLEIRMEEDKTVILGELGYLDSYETVKLEVSFLKFIEPSFSLRKYLNSSPILYLIVASVFICLIIISIMAYKEQSRKEDVSPDKVINELDPIEFSYLKILHFNPLVVLAGIFYLGTKKLLKIAVEEKALKLYRWGTNHKDNISIWAKYIYDELNRRNFLNGKELTYRELYEIAISLIKFDSGLNTNIREVLVSKGYLKKSTFEGVEGIIKKISSVILILAMTGIALHVYGVFSAFSAIFILGSILSVILIIPLAMIPGQTALGLGAIEAIKERAELMIDDIKNALQSGIELNKLLETFFGIYFPYVVIFKDVLSLLKKKVEFGKYGVYWIPYYFYYSPIIYEETPYPQRQSEFGTFNLGDIINNLSSFINSITSSVSGTGGTVSGGFGGGSGGFGGGGVSGFG